MKRYFLAIVLLFALVSNKASAQSNELLYSLTFYSDSTDYTMVSISLVGDTLTFSYLEYDATRDVYTPVRGIRTPVQSTKVAETFRETSTILAEHTAETDELLIDLTLDNYEFEDHLNNGAFFVLQGVSINLLDALRTCLHDHTNEDFPYRF